MSWAGNNMGVKFGLGGRVKTKKCPGCDMPIKGMTPEHYAQHMDRCKAKRKKTT